MDSIGTYNGIQPLLWRALRAAQRHGQISTRSNPNRDSAVQENNGDLAATENAELKILVYIRDNLKSAVIFYGT